MQKVEDKMESSLEDKEKFPLGYARKELILDGNGNPIDWKYLDVNPAFQKHTGISINGLVGKLNSEIMPDRAMYQDWLDVYYDVAFSDREEQFVNWAEPLQRWLEVSAYSPQKGQLIVFFQDVTKYEEEKRMYADILSNISDAVFITNDLGDFTYVCPNVSDIFGYSEEEVLEMKNIHALLGEGFYDIDEVNQHTEVSNIEVCAKCSVGKEHFFLVNIKKVKLAGGSLLFTCREVTDRLEIERTNEHQAAQLKGFMNAIPDLVWIKDPDGKYLACNKEFEKLFGAPESEILGKSDYDFVPKELADFFRIKDKEAIEEGVPRKNEETLSYADGSKDHAIVETTKTPVFDTENRLIGVLGVARDITQRKIDGSLFEGVFCQSPYGIALVAEDGRPYVVNDSLCRLLGYSESELKSKTFKEFTHPEDFPKDMELYSKLYNEEIQSYEIEKRYMKKSGETVYANLVVTMIEDPFAEGGKRALAMVNDVTSKVKAQLELYLTNQRYKHLIESAPDAVYIASKKGLVTDVNDTAINMSGYTRDELIGMPIWKLDRNWDEVSIQKFYSGLKEADAGLIESIHTMKDGQEIPVEVSVNPVKMDEDTWVIGMARDISARKEIEKQLSNSEAKYKGVIETASDAIYMVNMDGEITEANDMACQMLGYSSEEFRSMSVSDIDLDWDYERVKEFGKTLISEKRVLFETYHTTKDKRAIPIEMSIQYFEVDKKQIVVGIARDITDRKQYEASQKNMLLDLIRAQEIANMGSWHLDVTNNVLTWSDQVYRIFDEEPQSFDGTVDGFYEFVHPKERDQVRELFNQSIAEKTPYQIIHRIVTKKGEIKHVEEKAEIIYNEDNQVVEAHGTVQDVTMEVGAKHDLNLQIQKLNLAMVNNGILAWETDFSTNHTEVFPKGEKLENIPKVNVGSPEKLLSQIRNEHRVHCEKKLQKLQRGEIDHFTCEFQISDEMMDEWNWHQGDLTVLEKDVNGLPQRVFGTIQNINEKKDSERLQVISQEQERMRVARDIHDSIGQMLVGTRLMLNQTLDKKISYEKLRELNSSIDEMLGEMIRESRLIINNFGISISKNDNLKQTFVELAEKMKKVFQGKIHFNWDGQDNVDDLTLGVNLFRIFQEALTNAIKYSKAKVITLSVSNKPEFFMAIEDNGIGFQMKGIESGFGIQNMRERAYQIGGTLEIDSSVRVGTIVKFKMGSD